MSLPDDAMPRNVSGQPLDEDLEAFASGRAAAMLWVITAIALCVVVAVNVLSLFKQGGTAGPGAPLYLLTLVAVLYLLHRRRVQAALGVFLWSAFAYCIFAGVTVAGIYTPLLALLPLVCMMGGLTFGSRHAWLLLATSCLSLGIVAWAQAHGWIVAAIVRDPWFMWIVYGGLCTVGTVLGVYSIGSMRQQYRKAAQLGRELAALNVQLETKVTARTAELQSALETLRRAQDDLIQSEKLAALGSLVAGIAHELNTPIGNALTVASTIEEKSRELATLFNAGTLKRRELDSGLGGLADMAQLIVRSTHRAAALITSFKQVAVDQVSERRRRFELRELVEDIVASLRPGLRRQPWVIVNAVPEDIVCDSFPGPLGQILTNLIQNAVLHGFGERTHGQIEIAATLADGTVTLSVSDDGVGMDSATAARVFEPFFTTRLGRGGSGLGLAVCFRIATTVLAGNLRVLSSPGTGTCFTLTMPRRTPGAA